MFKLEKEISAYLDYCKERKKLSTNTIKAYTIGLVQFRRYMLAVEDCTVKSEIIGYVTYLHKTYSSRSVKRKLASLKAFFNYLEYEDIVQNNPINRIKMQFKEAHTLPRTIPLRDIQNILAVAYNNLRIANTEYGIKTALRCIAIIELLFATGLRVSELCSLKTNDVNLSEGNIRIMGKGLKERMLQIGNDEVLTALKQYKKMHLPKINDIGFFFLNKLHLPLSEQSVRFLIRNLCIQADITLHITPHMFRHSFATLLLEEDVDIRYIQRMLGHSSIQTTEIYTQVTEEKQRKILSTKHPRNKLAFAKLYLVTACNIFSIFI
ncbi:MAG: tyrosine-type recombinase/integrase [Oscillospiraceae bacterium]|nr:tyrosine-type recombinase/integrase [Oscillospiraceae bacterium]